MKAMEDIHSTIFTTKPEADFGGNGENENTTAGKATETTKMPNVMQSHDGEVQVRLFSPTRLWSLALHSQ